MAFHETELGCRCDFMESYRLDRVHACWVVAGKSSEKAGADFDMCPRAEGSFNAGGSLHQFRLVKCFSEHKCCLNSNTYRKRVNLRVEVSNVSCSS